MIALLGLLLPFGMALANKSAPALVVASALAAAAPPRPAIQVAVAMFATTLEICCLGFGAWQAWWVATVFSAVIWFGIVTQRDITRN